MKIYVLSKLDSARAFRLRSMRRVMMNAAGSMINMAMRQARVVGVRFDAARHESRSVGLETVVGSSFVSTTVIGTVESSPWSLPSSEPIRNDALGVGVPNFLCNCHRRLPESILYTLMGRYTFHPSTEENACIELPQFQD